MERRRLYIDMRPEDFGKLARLAQHNERRPEQEAAWLLRGRLARSRVPAPQPDRDLAAVGTDRPDPQAA